MFHELSILGTFTDELFDDGDIESKRRTLSVRGIVLAHRFIRCIVKLRLFKVYYFSEFLHVWSLDQVHKAALRFSASPVQQRLQGSVKAFPILQCFGNVCRYTHGFLERTGCIAIQPVLFS